LVQPGLRYVQDQEGADDDAENCELDDESMQVFTCQGVVKRPIPGVKPDPGDGRGGDDHDESNDKQQYLSALARRYPNIINISYLRRASVRICKIAPLRRRTRCLRFELNPDSEKLALTLNQGLTGQSF
jgi:hypothetical protein